MMTAFNPNLFDNVTTVDDIVLVILIVAIWFMMTIVIDCIYMRIAMSFYRRQRKKPYQFPKYLEDDEE